MQDDQALFQGAIFACCLRNSLDTRRSNTRPIISLLIVWSPIATIYNDLVKVHACSHFYWSQQFPWLSYIKSIMMQYWYHKATVTFSVPCYWTLKGLPAVDLTCGFRSYGYLQNLPLVFTTANVLTSIAYRMETAYVRHIWKSKIKRRALSGIEYRCHTRGKYGYVYCQKSLVII